MKYRKRPIYIVIFSKISKIHYSTKEIFLISFSYSYWPTILFKQNFIVHNRPNTRFING